MSTNLAGQIRTARRRRDAAVRQAQAARLVIDLEDYRIGLLDGHLTAGAGHVFTPDPVLNLEGWTTLAQPPMPRCRLCRASLRTGMSRNVCGGDNHTCQVDVVEGETPTAFRQYGHEPWLCGHRGGFVDNFRAWICTAGHRTDRPHQRGCLGNPSCPCRWLILDPPTGARHG